MIIVDTREHLIPQIKDLLASSVMGKDVPQFEFRCLPLADYLLENGTHTFLIERKNISDFCGTYRELKPRLAKMRKLDYERTGLLIEGTYVVSQGMVWLREGTQLKARMPYRTMSNFLTHQQDMGTKLFHTMCLEETIWRLIHIHNYLPKMDEPTPTIKAGSAIEWLAELPGIGSSKLKQLKENYSTPFEAVTSGLPSKAKQLLDSW